MYLKQLHRVELPRERLIKYGVAKLADYELLAILLGSGIKGVNVLELAKRILKKVTDVGAGRVTLEELQNIKGLGPAKAAQVVAIIALASRLTEKARPDVLSAKDIGNLCADFRASKKEHFVAFYLDTQNRLIERHIISVGTLDTSLVHPREVFEPALRLSAASVIVAHNHPSGLLEPSQEDIGVTKRLKEAGDLLGITLLDHVLLTATEHIGIL